MLNRDLAAFTRERLTVELTALTVKVARQDASEQAPPSDERLMAVAHLQTQLRIVDLYAPVADNDGGEYEYAYGYATGLGDAVRLTAAIYADHGDYREEWSP